MGVIVELPGKLRNLFSSSSNNKEEMMALDPFQLTREQMSIVTGLREAITAEVDKKWNNHSRGRFTRSFSNGDCSRFCGC